MNKPTLNTEVTGSAVKSRSELNLKYSGFVFETISKDQSQ